MKHENNRNKRDRSGLNFIHDGSNTFLLSAKKDGQRVDLQESINQRKKWHTKCDYSKREEKI